MKLEDRLEEKAVVELPRLIDIKLHAVDNIAADCNKLLLQDQGVLIVDDITYKLAGKKVEDNLIDTGTNIDVLRIDKASLENIAKAEELYKEVGAKFAVGAGGGTIIDVTKYSSFKSNLPFVSVPTAASHDGIASARASIKVEGRSFSYNARPPMLVIGDIGIISSAPKRFAIAGAGDLISNKTAVLDWELSSRITGEHMSQYAQMLSNLTADSMIASRQEIALDPIKRSYVVFKGLISSSMAMCIAGSSRPASGAEHLISHRLDGLHERPRMHGMQTGMLSIFTAYLHGANWHELKDTLQIIGAPISAEELSIDEDVLIEAIMTAQEQRPNRYTILSTGVTETAVKKALSETEII